MNRPLEGRAIALAEGRQLEDLATMLEQEGATALRYPLLNILDVPDPAPVEAWLGELYTDRFGLVILMTGEAIRRLLAVAEHTGKREEFIAALARTPKLSRGPKPVKVLRELGITDARVASSPTTDGVIATLQGESLAGKTVGMTLYGADNPKLEGYLRDTGANVRPVLSYIFGPSADSDRVAHLIEQLDQGKIDSILFTSSPQIDRLWEVARERGIEPGLLHGLGQTQVAAVGPLVAEHLRERGAPVHVCPEQGWVMKNLVRQIVRAVTGQ